MIEPDPIPFVREFPFAPGMAKAVSAHVRLLLAPNPGPFTGPGTNTYFIGHDPVLIVDPGPDLDAHFDAIVQNIGGAQVLGIFATHQHLDHTAIIPRLQAHFGCETFSFGPPQSFDGPDGMKLEEGTDRDFVPDRTMVDGDCFPMADFDITILHTPGHASNHVCFAVQPDNVLLTGDHVLGVSTSVVIPPDGNMGDYLHSLEKVRAGGFAKLLPAHGGAVTEPEPFLRAYIAHRHFREAQILDALKPGPATPAMLVPRLYEGLDKRLYPAAAISLYAHFLRLVETGQVACDGAPQLRSAYRLS